MADRVKELLLLRYAMQMMRAGRWPKDGQGGQSVANRDLDGHMADCQKHDPH